MKQYLALAGLVFVGVAAWRIAGTLSADALGMAVGVLFGVIAGLPAALLVMASGRRRDLEHETGIERRRGAHPGAHGGAYGAYPAGYAPAYAQPPVIVLAGAPQTQPGYGDPFQARHALPAPPETVDVRQFKVVGEKEEWVDEW